MELNVGLGGGFCSRQRVNRFDINYVRDGRLVRFPFDFLDQFL